jgi:hypothetical protein
MVLAGEKRLSIEHLGKDASSAPNVDLDVVFLPCEHDFGSAVVSCGDVASHLGILNSSEAKIANLEIAVFVDQNVAGLEITVDDAGRVDILEAALENKVSQ